ncbi:Premnaspirodiene oxygenase [Linum perenne]
MWSSMAEDLFSSPLFLPILTLSIILLSSTLIRRLTSLHKPNSPPPPGPWKLPIIGNLHQLVSILPHRRLRELAVKYGPEVMHLQLGQLSHIVISSAEAARQVMKTHDLVFASRPSLLGADIVFYAGSDLAFSAYTERYKQLRKICVVEVLGANRVRGFRSIREEEIANLVNNFSRKAAEGAVVDISEEVFWVSTRVTSRAALGKPRERDDGFLKIVGEVSDILGGFRVSDLFPSFKFLPVVTGFKGKLVRMHKKMDLMLDGIINEHKKKRSSSSSSSSTTDDDLVDVLLNLHESGDQQFDLTEDNIKAVTVEVFLAGVETSATAIDWTMAEMIKDERVLQKAQQEVRQIFHGKPTVDEGSIHELKYLDMVIKESLRLHPPLPLLLPRESQERVQINGYEIPANTKVIINGWAIGRDSRYWEEPEKFYPERFLDRSIDDKGMNFELIPFGSGRRMCPGMLYASAVVKLTLANLLYHFDWKLPDGMKPENLDMTEAFGVTVRRKCSLRLIPIAFDIPHLQS